jgi:hypothetical protein
MDRARFAHAELVVGALTDLDLEDFGAACRPRE